MNKKILGAGAASAVLAAMPLLGVFADNYSGATLTDEVQVTVLTSCTIATNSEGATKTIEKTVSNGSETAIVGTTMSITCNDGTGWHLQAKGTGGTSNTGTSMVDVNETYRIMSVSGSGSDKGSYWGMTIYESTENHNPGNSKEESNPELTFKTGYKSTKVTTDAGLSSAAYEVGALIPSEDTTILSANDTSANLGITPIYNVHVDSHLPQGTYTGKVTYTLAQGAGSIN